MTTYQYRCKVCGEIFEKKLHFSEEMNNITCPRGHREVQRVYTPPQIFSKGPGFYINDSKSKPGKPGSYPHGKE
jgi:putative FmdB family regulatory protein